MVGLQVVADKQVQALDGYVVGAPKVIWGARVSKLEVRLPKCRWSGGRGGLRFGRGVDLGFGTARCSIRLLPF